MLQLPKGVFHQDLSVTVSNPGEGVVLTINCPDGYSSASLTTKLGSARNPFISFQESVWESTPGVTAQITTKYGTVDFSFDRPGFQLPPSPNHIPLPSNSRDPGTGLKLRSGLIRDQVEGAVITVGQLDVANLGATNSVCGEAFANCLFSKLGEIAEKHGIRLYRYGGDEFAFTVGGDSEFINILKVKNFIAEVKDTKDQMIASLDEDTLYKLDSACEAKRIKKGREYKAEALDLYVGVASIKDLPDHDLGLTIQQLVGQAEKQVYNLKQSEKRFSSVFIELLDTPRQSDILFVENVRKIDNAANEIKQKLSNPNLSIPERYYLFQELIVTCSEDVSVNNKIVRAEKFEPYSIYVTQGMTNPSYIVLDIPAGPLNDTIGPDRADEYFSRLLGTTFVEGSCLTIRISGGGFKFVIPENQLSEQDVRNLRSEVIRRNDFMLSNIEQNTGIETGSLPNLATLERAA